MPAPTPRTAFVKEAHFDRFAQGVEPSYQSDVPVFDRASRDPVSRPRSGDAYGFRAASDRRPGTPLPPEMTGDPHPDRLARAEQIREQLKARDSRYRIPGSEDRLAVEDRPRRPGAKSLTPDIEKPRSCYVGVPAGSAFIEGRRGDDVLYFMTVSEAALCMTGESRDRWRNAIKNAADGTTRGAFGWTWLRLRSRRGQNR